MLIGYRYIEKQIRRGYEKAERWKKEHPNCTGKIPNPFTREEINVYTDVDFFISPYCFVTEYDYRDLGKSYADWVERTKGKLLAERTKHERMFSSILKQSNTEVIEQPYFKINDKGYFLDFYLPEYGLAFELNGRVHKGGNNENYDAQRDIDFHSIGIKTIRLSNLDIESSNIKTKINEWVNMAISGKFDPSLYYKRSDTRKFDGKQTVYEGLHKKLNEIIAQDKYKGKSLLIATEQTYFCKVLYYKRYDTSEKINKDYIDRFFDIIENNDISIGVYYLGKMDNMPNRLVEYCVEENNNATKRKIDYVIKIDRNEIREFVYPHSDVHPIQIKILKNKEGKSYFPYNCPYGMFYPFKSEDTKRKKYRKHHLFAGGNLCHFCKYHVKENVEIGYIYCNGFLNKESKNFYDNLALNYPNHKKEYQEYVDFKQTDDYKAMTNFIAKQNLLLNKK